MENDPKLYGLTRCTWRWKIGAIMKSFFSKNEDGQALIQVSIAMIVLLGFAALAIDVSFGYSQRRDMQNAADAGALAGAYELCFGDPAKFKDVAERYAGEYNRAQTVFVEPENEAEVKVKGIITVTTQIAAPTFFANVFGASELNVSAQAVSACGKANAACGLLPIGFEQSVWKPGDCGSYLVFWNDDNKNKSLDCTSYRCDKIYDRAKNVWYTVPVPYMDHRAWIDFTDVMEDGASDHCDSSGCGGREVRDRIAGNTGPGNNSQPCRSYARLEGCAADATAEGVNAKAWMDIEGLKGQTRFFPLYNGFCDAGVEGGSCGKGGYRISGFGCTTIIGPFNLCNHSAYQNDSSQPNPSQCNGPKVVVAQVACGTACATTCGTTTGEAAGPGDVVAAGILR
jgi:Flp pilus assembly protein TadG